jgi:hypothetical protein
VQPGYAIARIARRGRTRWPTWGADLVLVVVAELLVIKAVSPASLFSRTLPLGADNSGHPYAIQLMAEQLKHGSLTGWGNGWLSGAPNGVFYPWIADVVAAVLSWVLPLAVAYKLMVVATVAVVPISAFIAARWGGLARPFPVLFAIFTLPQLFDVSCRICGGSVWSTMTGEYAYQLGIALGLLAIGSTAKALRGNGSLGVPALMLALALLAHPVTALWTSVAVGLMVVVHAARERQVPIRWVVSAVVGLLLSTAWWLPFLAYRSFTPQPIFVKTTMYTFALFPSSGLWEAVLALLALVGLIAALRTKSLFVWALVGVTAIALVAFFALPTSQLPNFRAVPLWFTGRWLLVAFGSYDLAVRCKRYFTALDPNRLVPALALAAVIVLQGIPWGLLPGEHYVPATGSSDAQGRQHWLGLSLPGIGQSIQPAQQDAGYTYDKASRASYPSTIRMLKRVAATHGCGRIAVDEGGAQEPYFLQLHLMDQISLLTNGCLSYVVGTRGDSSLTFPRAVSTMSLISQQPEEPMPDVPYFHYSLAQGIPRAALLGLSYYITYDDVGNKAASQSSDLSLRATNDGIDVWQVRDAALVAPLVHEPERVGLPAGLRWQSYYLAQELNDDYGDVLYSPNGPANWPKVTAAESETATSTTKLLPSNVVSHVVESNGTITFDVTAPGVPVIVRTTYFPGWHVSGASRPYRATPDYMIVIPTRTHVTMTYRRTATIWVAYGFGVAGIVGLLALALADLRERRKAYGSNL